MFTGRLETGKVFLRSRGLVDIATGTQVGREHEHGERMNVCLKLAVITGKGWDGIGR